MTIRRIIIIFLLFLLLTGICTFPLMFKITSYIPGFYSSDEPFAVLWNFWWHKYAFRHHLSSSYYSTIAAPYGIDIGGNMPYPLWQAIYKSLSVTTNNVISYNIQLISTFVLSGITMYCLVYYMTKGLIPALFAGAIYLLCPYHFARAWQHLGLSQIQWMPFYLFSLIKLKDNPTYKNMSLAALGIFLVLSFELHYTYFMYIATVLFLLYAVFFYKDRYREYLRLVKMFFVVLGIGLFFIACTGTNEVLRKLFFEKKNMESSAWSLVRPFEDLFTQSARPLSYFLPATVHPVFGKFTEQFIGTSLYGDSLTEHTLYLGWIPLVLSFVAFKNWRKKAKLPIANYQSPITRERFYIGFFVFLAVASWLFSQPPWWGIVGFKVYMPSFFMYKILPTLRGYCRFGIVVMLAVAVLAGFGLKFILERAKTKKIRIAIVILSFAALLFEFWNYPPLRVIDVSRAPEVYYWLKEIPGDFLIAEYPQDTNGPNVMYMFYQAKHEKKIINGTIPGSRANSITKMITRLSGPDTAGILKWMGVKYVLVHKDNYLETGLMEDKEELGMVSRTAGLKFIQHFPPEECPQKDILCAQKAGEIDVYEVVASTPIEPHLDKKGMQKGAG